MRPFQCSQNKSVYAYNKQCPCVKTLRKEGTYTRYSKYDRNKAIKNAGEKFVFFLRKILFTDAHLSLGSTVFGFTDRSATDLSVKSERCHAILTLGF